MSLSRISSGARKGLALAILLLLPVLLLMPLDLPFDGRLMKAVETAFHFPLFFAGAWAWLEGTRPRVSRRLFQWQLAGLLVVVAALEATQSATGRDPDIRDVLYGLCGGGAAMLAWYALRTARRGLIAGAWALCTLLAVAVCMPSALILSDRLAARLAYPLLASFEGPSEVGRWWENGCGLRRVESHVTHGRRALRVALRKPLQAYPGIFMTDGVRNWTGYGNLCFDIYLTGGAERRLWVRADDRRGYPPYEDRAQTMITLVPGPNSICLDLDSFLRTPAGRALDRSRLSRWGMFFDAAQGGESFFLDHVRLTP